MLIFLGKETHSETKSWKSSRTLTKSVTTTTVNPGNRRGFCARIHFSFSFIFFHFLSFPFIFFFFVSGAQNLIFFLGLNFVTISLESSYVKNQFLGPSRVPLWALFSFFSYFFFLPFFCLFSCFLFFIFSHFLFIFSVVDFFFNVFSFFIFSEEKVSSILFSFISFKYFYCWRLVSEFNCFLRSRCSMEMW